MRAEDDSVTAMRRLVEALEVDLEWRDQHTRLAGRAREWLDSGRDRSYLIRGKDLRAAEGWLAAHEGHPQAPTREQTEYIARGRHAATQRLRAIVGALAVGLAIALVLTIVAMVQRQRAINETHVAQSQLLASQATSTNDLQVASLLAVAGFRCPRL